MKPETGAALSSDRPPFQSVDGLLRELAREPETVPDSSPEPSLPAGTTIGRFELLREIGRGGFGVVYEARDQSLGRLVAFKLVRGGRRMDLRRERLIREAEAAARLSHPNVVTLHDIGSSDYGPYLVLELLQGETLAARIRRGPIPLAEALSIAIDITTGLAHAHEGGVIHGDVTPGNVFLCRDGRVKLLDLGLAQVFGSSDSGGGTVGYMAPELRSGAPLSEATDLYALGVVLYRMVAGTTPYLGDDDLQRPQLALKGAPLLTAAIERLMATDAADRPASAAAALAELVGAREQLTGASTAPVDTRWSRRTMLAAGLVLVTVVAGALGLRGRGGPRRPPAGAPMLAVLPFADRSPERDQQYLADGVADQLRLALDRLDRVRVVARTSSVSVGADLEPAAAATRLGVSNVLVGTTRRTGDRLEVSATLHDAGGRTVWSDTYDRGIGDIFSIQDDITARTLAALGAPPAETKPALPEYSTKNSGAYEEFLRGRQAYYRQTTEDRRRARGAFERSIELDPSYAPGWSGLAWMLLASTEAQGPLSSAELRTLRQRALEAADKAVTLAPDLPDARSARGLVLALISGDWPRATADFNHTLALDPKNVDTLRRYGVLLASLGRAKEAVAAGEQAVTADPLNVQAWTRLSQLHAATGDLDRAERDARHALELAPASDGAPLSLGYILLLKSRPGDALAMFARCPEVYRLAGTAMAEHSLGHADRARAALDELTNKHASSGAFFVAQVHAWRGDKAKMFEWLDRAVANNEPGVRTLRADPILASRTKGDPRYTQLLRKLNLPLD